jgi:hypothetical protein
MTVSKNIEYYRHSGTVGPDYTYEDNANISGTLLTITRTGGIKVVTGKWDLGLTDDEIAKINLGISEINDSDSDIVSDLIPVGGGIEHLCVNGITYYNGWIINENKYHSYSDHVSALYNIIHDIIAERTPVPSYYQCQ